MGMYSHHSLIALCFVSVSAGTVFQRRGSANTTTPYSNVTLDSTAPVSLPTDSTATSLTVSSEALELLLPDDLSTAVSSSQHVLSPSTTVEPSSSPTPVALLNATLSSIQLISNNTSTAPYNSSIETPSTALSYPNATSVLPFHVNATSTRPASNATCTINIPSASIDYWFPPTYSHILGTMTTAAPNFTNVDSYTLIPHTTTFDLTSAFEYDYVCTTSESYISEWDWTMTFCDYYSDKPTAAATSLVYRSAAAPWPSGGLIPVGDALLYDLYTDGRPSATTTLSAAPNVTFTETSATPFVYFTAYEVNSGNKTETIQLSSAQAYPYRLKGVENELAATGPLPDGFIDQIPYSACDAGQLEATVTVLIVVDLYYQNWPNANPFIVHVESTVAGFEDPPVQINNDGTPRGQPLTVADWDLPGANTRPTPASIMPQIVVPTAAGNNNDNILNPGGDIFLPPNVPEPPRITVGTIGTNPVVVGPSSRVVVGSQTLLPGAAPITVGDGTLVSLVPSATAIVVGGTTSQLPQVFVPAPQPVVRPPPVLTIGSSTLTPNAATQFFIAPGQTLTPGGVATVDGTLVSLAPSASFVVIGGSTQVLPTVAPGAGTAAIIPPQIVFGGSTITAEPTVGGTGNPSNQNNQNGQDDAAIGPTFVIAGQTLAPGGQPITVSGTTISLATSASFIVINGVTSTLPAAAAVMTPPPLTIGDRVFTALPGTGTAFLISSMLLTPGGFIVVAGTTVSLAPGATALIINGQTSLITSQAPIITNPPLLTIGSQTYTAQLGAGTTFLIDGQTLTPGGTITVNGTTISLAPGATELIYGSSGRSTTTALFPATTTRSQSVTVVSSPSAGASESNGEAMATSSRPGSSASRSYIKGWALSIVAAMVAIFLA